MAFVDIDNADCGEGVEFAGAGGHGGGEDDGDDEADEAGGKVFGNEREEDVVGVVETRLSLGFLVQFRAPGAGLINAFLGGTLHLDNGEEKNAIHKKENDTDKEHGVSVTKDSLLFSIVQSEQGVVNSAHHQSIDKLANGLKAVAISDDGVIEAIELVNPNQEFLLGVQWHPERMKDKDTNPFSFKIKEAFLANVKNKLS